MKRIGNGLLVLFLNPTAELIVKKYYVGSGSVCWVLLAKNPDGAAIRFINLALQAAFNQGTQEVSEYQMVDWQQANDLSSRFGKRITVSEQGFSPREFNSYPTNGYLRKWKQQIQAVEQLIRQSR